jgi:hypothetical protein
MKTIKSMLARLFESNYTYDAYHTVRVHKKTGEIEYMNQDGWGAWWDAEPMFGWDDK